MKSYTDIEQSKKLTEILPIENADMIWVLLSNPYLPMIKAIAYKDFEKSKYYEILPAWSLTALLNELPNGSDIIKEEADTENERYMCTVGINDDIISTFANNPVDACVEMILKLKENKSKYVLEK